MAFQMHATLLAKAREDAQNSIYFKDEEVAQVEQRRDKCTCTMFIRVVDGVLRASLELCEKPGYRSLKARIQ